MCCRFKAKLFRVDYVGRMVGHVAAGCGRLRKTLGDLGPSPGKWSSQSFPHHLATCDYSAKPIDKTVMEVSLQVRNGVHGWRSVRMSDSLPMYT